MPPVKAVYHLKTPSVVPGRIAFNVTEPVPHLEPDSTMGAGGGESTVAVTCGRVLTHPSDPLVKLTK